MLTEALKREIEALNKIANARAIPYHILQRRNTYVFWYQAPDDDNTDVEFFDENLTTGLNRLMREIEAYPVVF